MGKTIDFNKNTIERIRNEIKKEAPYFKNKSNPQAREKVEIKIIPGQVEDQARAVGKALRGEIYQRGGQLVIIYKLKDKRPYEKYELAEDTIVIDSATQDDVQSVANEHCTFIKINERTRKFTPCDCPAAVAKQLFCNKKSWTFRPLAGIIQCPTIRNDGSLLTQPGYDEASGLYALFDPDDYPDILQEPTKEDALEALTYLKDVISEFPFKDDIDQSVALAAILTSLIRAFVKAAPMFAITAPCPGTGKSTLADLISIITTGKPAGAFQYFPDEIELAKSLFAILLSGPSVISFDNVTDIVRSRTLNSVLTQETLAQRLLGQSKTISVPTSTLIIMNGNNLTISEDMTRRVLYCCLDANVEKPAARKFKRNLYSFAKQERSKLITAILTILQAYQFNDCPGASDLKPMGSFEAWSNKIRGPLVWLEEPDPLKSQETLEALDPIRANTEAVFLAWYDLFGKEKKTTQEIIEILDTQINENQKDEKIKFLKDTLMTAILSRSGLNNRTLGIWLNKNKDTIYGGYKLKSLDKINGQTVWQLWEA